MENRFEKCCFDYDLVRVTTQCDRLNCEVNHDPPFEIFFQKNNDEYCYCLDRNQLNQYWRCVIQNMKLLCPRDCGKCFACKEFSLIYTELKESYFLCANVSSSGHMKPYQPVKWRIFTATNKKKFRIEIAKSIPNDGLVR